MSIKSFFNNIGNGIGKVFSFPVKAITGIGNFFKDTVHTIVTTPQVLAKEAGSTVRSGLHDVSQTVTSGVHDASQGISSLGRSVEDIFKNLSLPLVIGGAGLLFVLLKK